MAANPYELTTREVLSILFKEWRKLVGVFLALAVLVIGYSYTLTPYYEATARLLVKSGREYQVRSDPSQPVAAVPSVSKQEIVNSEIQILTSRDLVEAVVKRVGAARLYPGGWLASGSAATEAAVRKFFGDFKATPVELADVIEVSYRNANHDVAVEALNAIVDIYQKRHAEMFSDPKYKFLEQQTKQYETQLDAAARKVTNIKNSQSLFDVESQRAKLLDDRASVNTILQQLHSQSVDAHQRIDFLTSRLKTTPLLVPAGDSQSDVVEQARARLLDTTVRAQQLRERYTDPNIKPLQDADKEIAGLKQFITGPAAGRKQWSQRNPAYDELTVALNRALADAAPLDQEIALRTKQAEAIDAHLRQLEEGARSLDDAQRERRTLEELVHTYRARYEEARMNNDLDRNNAVSVSVVQTPAASTRPAGPRHLPWGLAGILLGALGAGGILVYLLVFRETLITVESVERIIGVPVLASVPSSAAGGAGNDNRNAA